MGARGADGENKKFEAICAVLDGTCKAEMTRIIEECSKGKIASKVVRPDFFEKVVRILSREDMGDVTGRDIVHWFYLVIDEFPQTAAETKKDILSERKPEEEESAITKLFVAPLNNFLAGKEESSDKFWLMDEDDMVDFINRFTHVAENEQLKYGVPASIILSSSLLLSEAGSSELSRAGNNFFALPCTADWMGKEDQYGGKCFRHYENAWTSFRDNSLYLTTYLFPGKKLPADDHKSWVTALEQVNYAEEPNLAAQLIKIINHFDLDELDK